ncbi:phospholipase DDHD2-like isoform X1 [Anneissia japonica]|uniref:phospholipase DDHD2-like isoform X1 n=1 Tax=Anneissia japonica TaxID=1529436 RepID=UPI0014257598|nr:phospholipase DDHD2-like isoform X1 [Anneissia japonica]
MNEQKENTPPLLLFPPSNTTTLGPDALRPVPAATASLFPAEDGEADSFLGQSEFDSEPNQSTSMLFQSNVPPPQDPFLNKSQSSPSVGSTASLFGPANTQAQSQQLFSSPSISPGLPPQTALSHDAYVQQPLQPPQMPTLPVSAGPPPGQPPPSGFNMRGYQHKPMPHPVSGGPPPQMAQLPQTNIGPPPTELGQQAGVVNYQMPQFDASRPPPTVAEVQQLQVAARPQPAIFNPVYQPVQPHWFYCKEVENKQVWKPFSFKDSYTLEETYNSVQPDPEKCYISTDGGRYDVNLSNRSRQSIYWEESLSQVRRCTWFYKAEGENRFIPYEESLADYLEMEFKNSALENTWNRRIELENGETVVMHNSNVIVHFRPSGLMDEWGTASDGQMRPRVVKRGVDNIDEILDGEPAKVDHLLFVVHGIGPVCDLRFRSIYECVDDFRAVSLKLLNSHFKHAQDDGRMGRVEFLPVYWYDALHGDATGVDRLLRQITLPSIGRLRHFTNDTLLDILFYSSPTYSQKIADVVGGEINRLYNLFMSRNPSFEGEVSVVGHSLGSLIMFDLLSHQRNPNDPVVKPSESTSQLTTPPELNSSSGSLNALLTDEAAEKSKPKEEITLEATFQKLELTEYLQKFVDEKMDMESLMLCEDADIKEMGLPMGPRKKLRGHLKHLSMAKEKQDREAEIEARIAKERQALVEEHQRSIQENLNSSVMDASTTSINVNFEPGQHGVGQPVVKYPDLEFSPVNFFALGSPIGMFLTVRGCDAIGEKYQLPTCPGLYNIFHPFDPVAYRIEPLVNETMKSVKPVLMPHHKGRKRFHLEIKESLAAFGSDLKRGFIESMRKTWKTIHEFAQAHRTTEAPSVTDEEMEAVAEKLTQEELQHREQSPEQDGSAIEVKVGQLNNGKRIDYVLQETPFESFNEYLFALSSHACYWESEDTALLMLKEIYAKCGIFPIQVGRPDSAPPTPRVI